MISVIVPYRDAERWIRRCADSLRTQEGDFEFIFVNDHSTDNGEMIVRHMADDRFVILDNSRTSGVSGARNTGLDAAKGEWITFLDADDEMLPDVYKIFVRMIALDDTANIIQANHLRKYRGRAIPVNKFGNRGGMYTARELAQGIPQCWCMVWNKLYRTSFLKENDIRFKEGMQYGEDELFNLECFDIDDRIFHTHLNTVTMMRHFDNRRSLSHTKGKEGLVLQSQVLEEFALRAKQSWLRGAVCDLISQRWAARIKRALL